MTDVKLKIEELSYEEKRRAAEALCYSNQIPITLDLRFLDPEKEPVRTTCYFKAMDGQTDLDAALLVWTEGKLNESATDEEMDEYWEEVTRPKWRRMISSQSTVPKFVTWEPKQSGEVPVEVLTDEQLTRIYVRIVQGTDTRLNEINPNLEISEDEWDAQFKALGEAFIISKELNIPLIEHCWMRASRKERQYALAVYVVGRLYLKKLQKEQEDSSGD